MSTIPFFDYPRLYRDDAALVRPAMDDVLERGAYILQRDVEDFEHRLGEFVGARHVIGVANGTDALLLALRGAGIGPGDEVIVPSHTYVASVAAIHFVGATPVLVECGDDHLIDPDDVTRAVSSRTRAIMPVQLNGRVADMDRLEDFAAAHDLLIIEDAAQGVGARLGGRAAGTFGIAGTYSFYPAKILGCFGDGGAVVTNDDDVAASVRLLRDHGRDEDGRVITWGFNSRLDNLQAAVLNAKLSRIDDMIQQRRKVAAVYCEMLADVAAIELPPAPDDAGPHYDAFQNFEIEAEDRDGLRSHLRRRGIGSLIQWGGTPVHQMSGLGIEAVLPRTDRLFERCVMLPMNQFLTEQDAKTVGDAVREHYSL